MGRIKSSVEQVHYNVFYQFCYQCPFIIYLGYCCFAILPRSLWNEWSRASTCCCGALEPHNSTAHNGCKVVQIFWYFLQVASNYYFCSLVYFKAAFALQKPFTLSINFTFSRDDWSSLKKDGKPTQWDTEPNIFIHGQNIIEKCNCNLQTLVCCDLERFKIIKSHLLQK